MDVDGQAAVGDQLTTDGGSAFGLRRGGMVHREHHDQTQPYHRRGTKHGILLRHEISSPEVLLQAGVGEHSSIVNKLRFKDCRQFWL